MRSHACDDANRTDVMPRQDSDTKLAVKVAASLTPRLPHVPHVSLQQRGEQNSGLFDIGALYAASTQLATARAQRARQAPPVMGVIDAPAAQAFRHPETIRPYEVEVDELIEVAGLPRRGRVGWFGVAVAWLGVATLGLAAAAGVPAHALRGKLARPATPVQAVAGLTTSTSTSTPTPTPTSTPTLSIATLPVAAAAANPVMADAPKPHPAAPAPHPRVIAPVRITQTEAPVAAPAPVTKIAVTSDPPATPKAVALPPAPPATPAPAAASLEDLMRRAVENDAKHH
jgi:hypothetical protein